MHNCSNLPGTPCVICTCPCDNRSPHLLEVRERIRISGRPLTKAAFVSYFWKVFEKLDSSKQSYSNSMPGYFRFLTVMAFTVFLQEKVNGLGEGEGQITVSCIGIYHSLVTG